VTPSPISIIEERMWSARPGSRTSSRGRAVRRPVSSSAADHREHHVDLVHVLDALEQVRDPLETHAGVDVLLRAAADDVEVLLGPHRAELVLHEDEVPDLEVAVLELLGIAGPVGGLELAVGRTAARGRRGSPSTGRRVRARHGPVVLLGPSLTIRSVGSR
jgi:hypothetical protein